jgi:drug/metabolite transporter (DMT)-like permease
VETALTSRTKVTGLAILISLLYGIQHPFSKPLASEIGNSIEGGLTLVAITCFVTLGYLIVIGLFFRSSFDQSLDLLKKSNARVPLFFAVFASLLGVFGYIFSIGKLDFTTVAFILNCGPIFAALAAKLISKKNFPRYFWLCGLASIVTLAIALYLKNGDLPTLSKSVGYIFITAAIPICYWCSFQIRHEHVKSVGPFISLTASQILSTFILLTILIVAYVSGFWQPAGSDSLALPILLYALGAVSLTVFASLLYQAALLMADGDSGYIASFNSLVPLFSAIIGGVLFSILGWQKYMPTIHDFWPALVIIPIFQIKNK